MYTSMTSVIGNAIVPLLGGYASEYDVWGVARALYEYDAATQAFVERADAPALETFLDDHLLKVRVDWVGGDTSGPYNARWTVYTDAEGDIESGVFPADEDRHNSIAALEHALDAHGYALSDLIESDGDTDLLKVLDTIYM